MATQAAFGPFPSGAFYAVHNGNIAAFSWAEIAEGLGLRDDCKEKLPEVGPWNPSRSERRSSNARRATSPVRRDSTWS